MLSKMFCHGRIFSLAFSVGIGDILFGYDIGK